MRLIVISLLLAAIFSSHAATEPTIVAKGPHHRVLQTTEQIQTPRGPKTVTNQIVELQGGLHRATEQGWVEANPRIELFQDGAIARNLQYGVATFAPNLATPGAIDLSMPEGRLQGHILGLAFSEADRFVMIAEIKDCAGVVAGDEQNELIFLDAFTDFDISVKFIVERDRISQNIILHQQLPSPSEWGLTENAVLEVLTEFTAFPELRKEMQEPIAGMHSEHLSFPSMEFVTGRAFSLDNEENPVVISKAWELFAGNRSCLVERVPWRSIAPEVAKLPPVAQGWRKKNNTVLMAKNDRPLPVRRQSVAAVRPIQMTLPPVGRKRGYLLDWELVASQNLFLWTNGATFYISGPITIQTNILEGGCVIKYAPTNSAQLSITRKVTCLSSIYSPIIMTARDDRSTD